MRGARKTVPLNVRSPQSLAQQAVADRLAEMAVHSASGQQGYEPSIATVCNISNRAEYEILPRPLRWPPRLSLCRWRSAAGPAPLPIPRSRRQRTAELADRETWDILTIQGVRVGYQHTTIRGVRDDGRAAIRVEQTMHMAIERFGEATVQDISGSCMETPQGRLLDFQSEIRQGPTPLRSSGKVRGDRMEVRTTTMGKEISASIPMPPDCGGFYAVEESLLRAPMQPGQRRTVNALNIANQVVRTELTAGRRQPVKLLRGEVELLPIAAVMRMPDGQVMQGTLWTDRRGEVLKTRVDAMGLETFRATKEIALAAAGPARLDFGLDMLAPLDGRLPRGHETQRARYRVELGRRRSGRGLRQWSVATGQVDWSACGGSDGLGDSSGAGGREPQCAGRSAHARPTRAEQLHPERRCKNHRRREAGRRRPERSLADRRGPGAICLQGGDDEGL